MITIKLDNIRQIDHGPRYIINLKRRASATSVVFIDDYHIIIGGLEAAQLYLYKLKDDSYYLIDTINTVNNNRVTSTDLIDHKDGLIITSNCFGNNQTLYLIDNNQLSFYKDIPQLHNKDFCHGIKFDPYNDYIIATTYTKSKTVKFINYYANKVLYDIKFKESPKDIAFIDNNKILVLCTSSEIRTNIINKNVEKYMIKYHSRIILLEYNLSEKTHQIIDSIIIPKSHGDSICYYNNIIVVNNQLQDEVNILYLDNSIKYVDTITGFNFPHCVAINKSGTKLAVSNYGNNTVNIIDFDTNKYT